MIPADVAPIVLPAGPAGDLACEVVWPEEARLCLTTLGGSPRSASVRATRALTAFRFPRQPFTKLLADGNLAAYKLVYQISLVLVSRQRRTTSRLAELMGAPDESRLRDALIPIVDQSAVAE